MKQPIVRLRLPYGSNTDRYFSIEIKSDMVKERAEYKMPSKLFVVSDIDGNFKLFQRLLIKNRVTNNKHEWLFEDGHLVILGNCLGKSEPVVECLWFIYALEEKAKRHGGYVHFILGDVEAMNINGSWRYLQPNYAARAKSGSPLTVLFDGNRTISQWLKSKNVIERIGNILFVHGGVSPKVNDLSLKIGDINRIAGGCYSIAPSSGNEITDLLYYGEHSLLRYKGYEDSSLAEPYVDTTLSNFNVSHIVTGHTMANGIFSHYNGKVFNVHIDYSDRVQALVIEKGIFYSVDINGLKAQLFPYPNSGNDILEGLR